MKLIIGYLVFVSSFLILSAEEWKQIGFKKNNLGYDGYSLCIITAPLILSDNGSSWGGEYRPFCIFKNSKNLRAVFPCSNGCYEYGVGLLKDYDAIKITKEQYKEKQDAVMRNLSYDEKMELIDYQMSLSNEKNFHDYDFYYAIPIEVFLTIFEFALNDVDNNISDNNVILNRKEENISDFKEFIREQLNKYSKEFIEISCGDGVVALRDGMLSLRKKNKDGTFSVIAQTTAGGTDLMSAYLKANGGQVLLEGTGKVTINKGFGNEDKGLSYLLKTRVLWNYFVRAVLMQKPEADKAFIAEIAAEDVKQGDLEIPATFPENLKTPEAAKALALSAYNKKYEALKTQDGASLLQPEKFIYKILKLKSPVDKFAAEGTMLWQVDMYDAASNLICSAWINPENQASGALRTIPQTIFPLEPLSEPKTITANKTN